MDPEHGEQQSDLSEAVDRSDSSDQADQPSAKLSPAFVVGCGIALAIPGLIPLYYASQTEDELAVWMLLGLGVTVELFNLFLLILLYRWFNRFAE